MNKRKSMFSAVSAIGALIWLLSFYAILYFTELPIWGYILVALVWFLLLLGFFEYKEKVQRKQVIIRNGSEE